MRPSQLRATAFHEAGHAVAAYAENLRIRKATIIAERNTLGYVLNDSPSGGVQLDCDRADRARLRAERAIIICLAGPVAQKRYSPRSWRNVDGSEDYEQAKNLAIKINGSTDAANAHLKWLEIQTRDLVELRWREVEIIAEALLREQTLDQTRIQEILGPLRRSLPEKKIRVTDREAEFIAEASDRPGMILWKVRGASKPKKGK